jgi:hypothetical protein
MSYIGNSPGVASQRVTTTLTATAAQTQFTTQSGYVLGYVDVYLNGAKLVNGSDFEAITGTYITLFSGAAAGDVVELISYVPRGLSDGYTKAEADAKFLDVGGDTATGNLSFATATLSGNLTLNGGTANGVGYLNGSKVVTTGSALTFDGTILAAPTLNLTNALSIAYGGTGQTTAAAALNALLPTQTGNATKYLQTDGTNTTWDTISISTADITGTLPIANGGTGATTAAGALTSLGAYAATNPSGYTTNLGTVTSVGGTGTVNGLTLTGTVSTTGNLTLGGTLDLSAYSAAGAFSTLSASGAVTLSGGTANGVAYLNGSKVLTTGSALTFNGTSLGVGSASYGNAGNINVSVGVPGTTVGGLQLWSTTTGNHYVQFGDGTTGTETYRGAVGYNHTADNLVFYSAGALGMTLTASSLYTENGINVGIGTSSTTSARLTVSTPNDLVFVATSSTTGNTNFRVSNTAAGGSNFDFASGSTGHYLFGYGTIPLVFGTNGTARASISSDGNFFISSATTNTNSSKLVVNGTISQTVNSTQYLVVDQSDVGTAPNQIPLNQYLGSMAFQDRENINFTGGTGALSSLDIAAISAQLNVSAVDVFVYDTAKDSDGGAWRKRCQHTSWYNETLNTATRGARREFPAVAVIVATTNSVTIHDGDDPTLPMWMIFVASRSPISLLSWYTSGTGSVRAVHMLNGILSLAMGGGIMLPHFISDKFKLGYQTTRYALTNNTIAQRNNIGNAIVGTDTNESYLIQDYLTNDITMTVLPNAPIDSTTGLPIPTIAVATNIGVSVVNNNGTVANLSSVEGNDAVHRITFTDDNRLAFSYSDNASNAYGFVWVGEIPAVSYAAGAMHGYSNPTTTIMSEHYNYAGDNGSGSGAGISTPYPTKPRNEATTGIYGLVTTKNRNMSIGSGSGLMNIIRPTPHVLRGMDGAANAITSTYNTGWMPGDVKGAWLSDTAQETVIGSELITNGTFDSSTTGWTAVSSTLSVVSGALRITNNAGAGNINGRAQFLPGFATIPGKSYVFTVTGVNRTAGNYYAEVRSGVESTDSWASGSFQKTFVAVQTVTYVELYAIGGAGVYAEYDNVSVRIADADRSVNNKGLQTFGTITKTPVAVGADLVGYSGWGSGKYLYSPLSTAYSLGSGDFSLTMWIKPTQANTGYIITQNIGIRVAYNSAGALRFHVYGNAGTPQFIDSTSVSALNNIWHQCVFVRRNGKLEIYINGVLSIGTIHSNQTETFSNATDTFIGVSEAAGGSIYTGELALMRLSATVPSQEQITKMYNDEKYLFQENAKATLYGTSDAVTALAYDTDTQLLHAGTSSGRSVFDGLRRVDNTTTAVATAISAVDGLIVEN